MIARNWRETNWKAGKKTYKGVYMMNGTVNNLIQNKIKILQQENYLYYGNLENA